MQNKNFIKFLFKLHKKDMELNMKISLKNWKKELEQKIFD